MGIAIRVLAYRKAGEAMSEAEAEAKAGNQVGADEQPERTGPAMWTQRPLRLRKDQGRHFENRSIRSATASEIVVQSWDPSTGTQHAMHRAKMAFVSNYWTQMDDLPNKIRHIRISGATFHFT